MTTFESERSVRVPPDRQTTAWVALVAFVVGFVGSLAWHRASAIHDTDSYFHLAMARLYAAEGVHASPPLRGSLLGGTPDGKDFGDRGFGDKEWLYHAALAPLVVAFDDPLVAGRVALALCFGLLAAVIAALASRAIGPWAVALPFWLLLASTPWAWRIVRLRPEVDALALLLVALWAFAAERDRLLGGVVFAFTLLYTAFHALVGLVALCVLAEAWCDRRWHLRALLYTVLGAGLALLVHPPLPGQPGDLGRAERALLLRQGPSRHRPGDPADHH